MDQLKTFFEKNRTAFFILGGILLLAMPAILNTPYLMRIGIMNWYSLTRGPMGIPGVPMPKVFGMPFTNYSYYYYLILVLIMMFKPEGIAGFKGMFPRDFELTDVIKETLTGKKEEAAQ